MNYKTFLVSKCEQIIQSLNSKMHVRQLQV